LPTSALIRSTSSWLLQPFSFSTYPYSFSS
jgi:hypothetical protein